MPEILIRNTNPDLPWGVPGRAIKAVILADLPDKSGRYEVLGSRLDLNLVGIKYQSPRERVRTGMRSVLIGDPGDYATTDDFQREEYQYTELAGIRSWPCIVVSELVASREGNPRRIIPINRRGIGIQTISPDKELVIRLHKPIIDYIQGEDGRWIQLHYYPDYPQMSVARGYISRVVKAEAVAPVVEPKKPEPEWRPSGYGTLGWGIGR